MWTRMWVKCLWSSPTSTCSWRRMSLFSPVAMDASFVGVAACGTDADRDRRIVMVTLHGLVKSMPATVLAKDAARAKRRPQVSCAHSLKSAGDSVIAARAFSTDEMGCTTIVADVAWKDRNGKRHEATREVPMSELLDRKDGLTGSGRRLLETNGGKVTSLRFEHREDEAS